MVGLGFLIAGKGRMGAFWEVLGMLGGLEGLWVTFAILQGLGFRV